MELLLHYVWKHRLFPLSELQTTNGQTIEVIDCGLQNRNAGPDFFNAKVKIDDTIWIGNVEIHLKASEWYTHRHEKDPHYDNVILHVVAQADATARTSKGDLIPQMLLKIPPHVAANYQTLLATDHYPPCYKIIPTLPALFLHSWMNALQTERLETRTTTILQRLEKCQGDWASTYFVTLARNFGFGINGDAFETWAACIPLNIVAHHSDDLFQIEALFMGQAGLLTLENLPERHRESAASDAYFLRLRAEYRYLAHKFSLQPMNGSLWRFLRLRPQNFPHIRIAQLAQLFYERRASFSCLLECQTIQEVEQLLCTCATPYWHNHYSFGNESKKSEKQLSLASRHLIIINTVIPLLFAYGRHRSVEAFCNRSFAFADQLKPERNHIINLWKDTGFVAKTSGDSQALIQLKKAYCDRRDCLRCRIGYEYLKAK